MDVPKFVDYNTIVSLGFVNKTFHCVVLRNAAALAMRQRLTLNFACNRLSVLDEHGVEVAGTSRTPDTVTFVNSTVGLHGVARVNFRDRAMLESVADGMFDALPVLRFVERLEMGYRGYNYNIITFLSGFAALKSLRLAVDPRAPLGWTALLRSRCALGLEELILPCCPAVRNYDEADMVRYCFDFSRLPDEAGKVVKMRHRFSQRFLKNVLKVSTYAFRVRLRAI